MALGTVTQVVIDPHSGQAGPVVVGDLKMTVTNIVGDSSYATGGSALTPAQLGLTTVFAAQAEVYASTGTNASSTAAAVVPTNNGTTLNLKAFSNANAEIAASTNLSGVTWQIIAFGY